MRASWKSLIQMLAVVGAAAEYYTALVGFIMSFVYYGAATIPTELTLSQIDPLCSDHPLCRNSQQTWCRQVTMQSGPKEPSPVSSGYVQRSIITPVIERVTLGCTLMVLFFRWFWNWGSRDKPQPSLPHLNFRASSLLKYVLRSCYTLREPFIPTAWASFGYLQTLLGVILSDGTIRYRREVLQMSDGGIVALDWAWKNSSVSKRKRRKTLSKGLIVIIPDLVAGSGNVSRLCSNAYNNGYEPVVFHRRGTNGLPLSTPKCQSLGDPSDLRDALCYLSSRLRSGRRISAIGLGFGGSLLLSYLGNYGSSSRLSAAVCLSPIYDLESTIHKNRRNSLLKWFTLQLLKLNFTNHVNTMPKFFNLDAAFSSGTLTQWLESVDCPMYKMKDMVEYWEHNEPLREADEIAVPLLCINSFDDPVVKKEDIPNELFSTLPNLLLMTTESGGHCGFLQDSLNPKSWAHTVAMDYIEAALQFTENVTNERIISGRMRVDS
ncbi:protein ABHD15-like [Lytechinus variegatus]|uniref:protein ABHD15-like n=1 Tax=Lytechinus variegatus TaxID=7654 RepID=UPI001BB26BFA|nr:protein ABHD15-like [Lytechinus variegatus]